MPWNDQRLSWKGRPQPDTGRCVDLNVIQISFSDPQIAILIGRRRDRFAATHFLATARDEAIDQLIAQLLKIG